MKSSSPYPPRGPAARWLPCLVALALVVPGLAHAALNVSPSFSSAAGINDKQTRAPFASINISHTDSSMLVTGRVSFPIGRGALAPTAGFVVSSDATFAYYTLNGVTASNAQVLIRALVYTPVENRIPIGSPETTSFQIDVDDTNSLSDSATVNLTVTPVNDAPHVNNLASVPTALNDNQSVQLFAAVTVTDVDNLGTHQVSLTLSNQESAAGTFRYLGANVTGLAISGTPALVTATLQSLVFDSASNRVPAGQTYTRGIQIKVQDAVAEPAPENAMHNILFTSINDPPSAIVTLAPPSFNDTTDQSPFRITLSDFDLGESLSVAIQPVSDPSYYFGTLSTNGPFSGANFVIQNAIAAVRFSPIRNRVTNSQPIDFRFVVTDRLLLSGSVTGRVTLLPFNDPPAITGVPLNTIHITDDPNQLPLHPFSSVSIADPDAGETNVVVTLALSDPTRGTFSQSSFSGPATFVTAALRATTFLPLRAANRVLGQTVTVTVNIAASDSASAATANNQTKIAITAVNAPPVVIVPTNQPVLIPPAPLVGPFTNVLVLDDDVDYTYTTNGGGVITTNSAPSNKLKVTVSLDNPQKGVLTNLGGFLQLSNGTYQITTNAIAATTALANMLFDMNDDFPFLPSSPGGTRLTIKAADALLNQTSRTLDILLQNEPVNRLVTRIDDDGLPGSLRYAVTNSGNNDVITFALASYPELIRLNEALGPMELRRNLTFKGPGADLLTISGDTDGDGDADTQLFRVFASVTMEGVTLTKGKGAPAPDGAQSGGAIFVGENGRLLMRYCAITDSRADQWGGAIDVALGSLSLDHCLVRGNSVDPSLGLGGGAISLYTTLPCAFSNTTFSANRQRSTAGYGGGAAYAEDYAPAVTFNVTVLHCTFAGNEDAANLGTSIAANAFGTEVRIRNSIFNDSGAQNLEVQGAALIISEGGNISNDSTRTILTQAGVPRDVIMFDQSSDRINTNPRLAALANTKPTASYPLLSISPAINLAVGAFETTDQTGAARDDDPDSGAVERGANRQFVLNEIHFSTGEVQFLEFYLRRTATSSLNIGGYSLWIDGVLRHQFAPGTSIQPGRGIIVADAIIPAGDPTNGNPTIVVTPLVGTNGGQLHLGPRGRVELRRPDPGIPGQARVVNSMTYVGVFEPVLIPSSSLTLLPQFLGFAYLPHWKVMSGNTNSPGRGDGTPFGSPNALPTAVADTLLVGEDEARNIPVLANDVDADGGDVLFIVDVSRAAGQGGDDGATNSLRNAPVQVDPSGAPLRGTNIIYDPRHATVLQSLPEGATMLDEFYYSIIDYGTGVPESYATSDAGTKVLVTSSAHRLTNGEPIVISGAGTPGYNGVFVVSSVTDDSFKITTSFIDDPAEKGSWITQGTRQPFARSEGKVTLTILGANDPPTPAEDHFATKEDAVIRIMADAILAGTTNVAFDTDPFYVPPPIVSTNSLLINDTDPDTDDNRNTLKVVGVAGRVFDVSNYEPTETNDVDLLPVVKVIAPNHGLSDGQKVLISDYSGHPSYNALHLITLIDSNSFTIPVLFVDNEAGKGFWGVLDDATRLTATSLQGAEVKLEIRADRIETGVIYNPRVSEILNHLGVGTNGVPQVTNDTFYYAAQDSHGALAFARVIVAVSGVNDIPVPRHDPTSLVVLDPFVGPGQTLSNIIGDLDPRYFLPPISGNSNRVDVQVEFDGQPYFLGDIWITDEDTELPIPSSVLLGNDSDVDFIDVLNIASVSARSHLLATVTLAGGGTTVVYNPAASTNLNKLAREEVVFDAFEITVTDRVGGTVTTLVSVLVVGVNDKPVAQDDATSTPEDVPIAFDPTAFPFGNPAIWDFDVDINGHAPDNRLTVLPVVNVITPGGARVDIGSNVFHYNPAVSPFLDGLAVGQTFVDTFVYHVTDASFLFANDDLFKVRADGAGFVLAVLVNDVNYNVEGSAFQVVEVGTPSRGGTVANNDGTNLVYTPQINFVGDEVFTYKVRDEFGNEDSALVTVRVTVNQRNGQLQANNDDYSVAKSETALLDVLANDNIIPEPGSLLSITRVSTPSAGGAASISAGRISYTPDPLNLSGAYLETFTYEITGGGTATATGLVQVVVTNRIGTLAIQDDAFSVQSASHNNVFDVLFNDGILPAAGVGLKISSLNTNGLHGLARIAADGSSIIYTPDAGFVGLETNLTYVASDTVGGTGTGRVRIFVGGLSTCPDAFVVNSTNITDLDVLANDRVIQRPLVTLTLTGVTPAGNALGTISVVGNKLRFVPNGALGETNFVYTVTDGAGGTTTGLATIATADAAVGEQLFASADTFSALRGSVGNGLNVLSNDVAVPDFNRPLTIVSIGTGIDAPNRGGVVTIGSDSRQLLYTPAPGFSGEETFTYTMTDSRVTDTAKVIVKVGSGSLIADDDEFTVYFETNAAGPLQFALPVMGNDQVLPNFGQVLTITGVGINDTNAANAPSLQGDVAISGDATALLYTPRDPNPSYVERFTYEITDGTARRAQGVVRVKVQYRANVQDIATHDDHYTVSTNNSANTLAVLANDGVKPGSANLWTITGLPVPPSNGVAIIVAGTISYTPAGGFVGTDHFTYVVSDGLGGTGVGLVTVKVGEVNVCADIFVALSGTTNNLLPVLANDFIAPNPGKSFLIGAVGSPDHGGTATPTTNGLGILYAPDPNYPLAGLYPYQERFWYDVLDDSGGTHRGYVTVHVFQHESDRDDATIFITVHGVNDAPVISGAGVQSLLTDKQTGTPFANVVIGDVDNQGQEAQTVTVIIDDLAKGHLSNLGAFVEGPLGTYTLTNVTPTNATAAIRGLVFVPVENRIVVPTTENTIFTVLANDSHLTTTNTVIQPVQAVNDAPLIAGTISGLRVHYRGSLRPFYKVFLTEVDDSTTQRLVIRVTLDNPIKGYFTSIDGFSSNAPGVYVLTNATAASATVSLRGLVFVPTPGNRVGIGSNELTRLTISVDDRFAPPVLDTNTTVLAYNGLVARVQASDLTDSDDYFGAAVAATRDLVAVGEPEDDHNGGTGSAFIYARRLDGSDGWNEVKKIYPPGGDDDDDFGFSLALSGETLVVGAPDEDDDDNDDDGAVYIFSQHKGGSNNWGFVAKLVASDGNDDDDFGYSVAIDSDTIAIGARDDDDRGSDSGSVYIFVRSGTNWVQSRKLTAADGASDDEFGYSVSLHGHTLVAGARNRNQVGSDSGAAYVFYRDQGGSNQWGQVRKLVPSDANSDDHFGTAVSVDGDIIVVGAPSDNDSDSDTGSAYLFSRNQGGTNQWGQIKKLLASDRNASDRFGRAVGIDGDNVVIGAPDANANGSDSGAAYLFARNSGGTNQWNQIEKFVPGNNSSGGHFGSALSVKQRTLAVGAPFEQPGGPRTGTVYIYRLKFDNAPMLLSPIADLFTEPNQPFSFILPPGTFDDPDLPEVLTLSASGLPSWLTFNPLTGGFSGTPTLANLGIQPITVVATDDDGQSALDVFNVTVRLLFPDVTAPLIFCPTNVTVQCEADVPAANFAGGSTSDAVDPAPVIAHLGDVTNGLCPTIITRTYNATDYFGNSNLCAQIITVRDTTPPVIACGSNLVVEFGVVWNFAVPTTSDNCSGLVTLDIADTITNAQCGRTFTATRSWLATDVCGNTSTCTQIVTVVDTTAPAITAPSNIIVSCAANIPAPDFAGGIVSDVNDLSPIVTHISDVSSGISPRLITRTYRAVDVCGNASNAAQNITVLQVPPVIAVDPQSQTNYLGSNVTFSVTASGCPELTYQWHFGTNDLFGATNATLALTNLNYAHAGSYLVVVSNPGGSSTSAVAVLTVPDVTVPTLQCPSNVVVQCLAEVPAANFSGGVVTDDLDLLPSVVPVGDVTNGVCPITITRTYRATDASGNSVDCTQTITVQDTVAPVIVCTGDRVIQIGTAWDFIAPAVSDNCSPAPSLSAFITVTNAQCGLTFTATRIWLAADVCGNTTTCTQSVIVIDTVAPTLTSPSNLIVSCSSAVPAPDFTGGSVTDAGDSTPLVVHIADVSVGTNPRVITRSYRATDACGNSRTNTQQITVAVAAPIITLPPQNQTNQIGSNAVFTVTATACAPLTFQWSFGTNNLVSQTNDTLTLTNVLFTDAGEYFVRVSNLGGSVTSTVAVLTVNRPPVAGADAAATVQNVPAIISATNVLANDFDPDSDPLAIISVSSVSTNGAGVSWAGGDIIYTPVLNFTGTDRFSYTMGDGRGGTATAEVEVIVASTLAVANKLSIHNGCTVVYSGTPGQTYILERSFDFQTWTPILTNAPINGIIEHTETNCPSGGAFFRVLKP